MVEGRDNFLTKVVFKIDFEERKKNPSGLSKKSERKNKG